MSPHERLARLDAVAARLPFAVDDHDAANAAYARWSAARAGGAPDDDALVAVELWAYCYVQRHALVRFVREPRLGDAADLDALVSSTFLRVHARLADVRDPARFSHWVAVACRNAFLSHCRRRALAPIAVDDPGRLADAAAPETDEPFELDRALVRRTAREAIGRLPAALREVAARRLLQGEPYETIAAATGHPPATVRAYVAKAVARLRDDPALRALARELAEV